MVETLRDENTRGIALVAQAVSADDMRAAMGPLYDSELQLPNAFYKELSLIDSHREQQLVMTHMLSARFSASGPQRENSWSDAWAECHAEFVESGYDLRKLDPKYVSANPIVRWMGYYVRAESSNFEMNVYRYIRETVFRKLMRDGYIVHDVGAGSCFNSVAYFRFNPARPVHAYDWAPASQKIADDIRTHYGMPIYGKHFNFFQPDLTLESKEDIVLTTCAMEQLGESWRPFLDNLLAVKPKRVVHIEPIFEKYADDRGFDTVAREYHLERNYLRGYYPELLRLRDAGKINIVCDHRTGIGSRFHECYTVIAWEPL